MSYRSREKEIKLIVGGKGLTLDSLNKFLLSSGLFSCKKRMVYGHSTDTYWMLSHLKRAKGARADFIRMRIREDNSIIITAKGKDKGNNTNRMEKEVYAISSESGVSNESSIYGLLSSIHGDHTGKITKTYYVYWLESSEHTNISIYTASSGKNKYPHIFLEIESESMKKVLSMEKEINKLLESGDIWVKRAPGSLSEIFFTKGKK